FSLATRSQTGERQMNTQKQAQLCATVGVFAWLAFSAYFHILWILVPTLLVAVPALLAGTRLPVRQTARIGSMLLLLIGSTGVAMAQTQYNTQTITGPATYKVVAGDRVWNLNPANWERIAEANAFLASRKYPMPNGGDGLKIYPGETLTIPAGVTITFRRPHLNQAAPAPAPNVPIVIAPANAGVTWAQVRNYGLLMLLLMVVAMALIAFLLYRVLRGLFQQQANAATARHELLTLQLQHMERRLTNHQDAGHGYLRALTLTLVDAVGHLRGMILDVLLDLVADVRRTPPVQQPAAAAQPARVVRNVVDPDGPTDFVEVHRYNGERLSLLVVHGTTITSVDDGVAINGVATTLTANAARQQRDRQALLRQELADDMFAGV
ncbi:MAG: hypothetical protein KW802_03330, partial [Candidatus Doudnabacteria bacterium]|nr:hypothetical protein [Candidatus Doudnabacteria bacterium]